MQITLTWFRDYGRGQEAADRLLAEQYVDIWPMASVTLPSVEMAKMAQEKIYNLFKINALIVVVVDETEYKGYRPYDPSSIPKKIKTYHPN